MVQKNDKKENLIFILWRRPFCAVAILFGGHFVAARIFFIKKPAPCLSQNVASINKEIVISVLIHNVFYYL